MDDSENNSKFDVEEIRITVPWGLVAAKLYGDPLNQHVLLIHGIMDNLGSFERLIQHLPDNFFYVSIDLPGHGKSTPIAKGMIYNTIDNLLTYRAVFDYFSDKNFIIIGHNYGGQLGLFFTQLYPERVVKVCMLDTLYLMPIRPSSLKRKLLALHDAYFGEIAEIEDGVPPEYTKDQAIEVIRTRTYGKISKEAAFSIFERAKIPQPNGKFQLSTDHRLKWTFAPTMDRRYIIDFIKKNPIKCPVLIILASESEAQLVFFKPVYELFKSMKNVKIKMVDGNHDVHNDYPETIAPILERFLLEEKDLNSKL